MELRNREKRIDKFAVSNYIGLAHELIHAHNHINGKDETFSVYYINTNEKALGDENDGRVEFSAGYNADGFCGNLELAAVGIEYFYNDDMANKSGKGNFGDYTENAIRAEHSVPLRIGYGKCKGREY